MKKISQFISKFFSAFVIVSLVIVAGGLAFLYLYPFNVAQINKIHLLQPVQAGGTIKYNVDYCRYVGKGVDTLTRRFLIPKNTELNAIELSSNPNLETIDSFTGCRTTAKPITLPVEVATPPGEYQLLIQVRYCIFVGRCITVEGYSDPFNIDRPSVPNQLSIIHEQLEGIEDYLQASEVNANTQPAPTLQPQPDPPVTNTAPQQSTQQSSQPATVTPSQNGLIRNTLDSSRFTINNITRMLGL